MSERDPRRRRKKRGESGKKDEKFAEDVSGHGAERIGDWRRDSRDSDDQEDLVAKIRHEPSQTAKIVFFILFTLLAITVGIVFVSLHGTERGPIDIFEEAHEPVEIAHGELDEHGKEIEHDDSHEEEEHAARDEEEEVHEEEHDEHDDDDSEKGFFSGFMDIFMTTPEEPTEEAGDTAETEDSTLPPTKEKPEEASPLEEGEVGETSEQTDEGAGTESVQEEPEEIKPSQTEAPMEMVMSDVAVDVQEEQDDVESDKDIDGGDEDDLYIAEAWVTEHIPVTSNVPPVVEEETSDKYESLNHAEEASEFTDYVEETYTIEEPSLDEAEPEPTESYYENDDITNAYDYLIKEDLDDAEKILEKSPAEALEKFDNILLQHPNTSRGRYGKARALDMIADAQRNNKILEQAIIAYEQVLLTPNVPDKLYRIAGERAIDRMRFRGLLGRAIHLQKMLAERYTNDTQIRNQLAVSYLLIGKGQEAKKVLKEVLEMDAENGYAKVHYGFILKTEDKKYEEAIKYLREGIASQHEGVIDGRFFFHLGDALARIGKPDEAMKVYEEGASLGIFRSAYQRSLYNVDELTAKPWWKPEETPYYHHVLTLEKHWEKIRDEGRVILNSRQTGFMPEAEGLRDTGDWQQFELFARGRKVKHNCQRVPFTCSLVENIPDAANCKRGQVKFSVMEPGTHVWAHTGPTNCRLRAHLGLVIPPGVKIRVANETRSWVEGKMFIFDDSFEHEVWHNGDSYRLVFIIDFWHPELTVQQKSSLTPI